MQAIFQAMPGAAQRHDGLAAAAFAGHLLSQQQRWHTQVIHCPKAKVGRVIGKEGITIKGLQAFTGGMIQIDQTSDPTRVTVAGTREAMELCVDLIEDIIAGQFKGFAMLKQWMQDVENDAKLPKGVDYVVPQRPLYVKGYGFVPPSQLGVKGVDGLEPADIFAAAAATVPPPPMPGRNSLPMASTWPPRSTLGGAAVGDSSGPNSPIEAYAIFGAPMGQVLGNMNQQLLANQLASSQLAGQAMQASIFQQQQQQPQLKVFSNMGAVPSPVPSPRTSPDTSPRHTRAVPAMEHVSGCEKPTPRAGNSRKNFRLSGNGERSPNAASNHNSSTSADWTSELLPNYAAYAATTSNHSHPLYSNPPPPPSGGGLNPSASTANSSGALESLGSALTASSTLSSTLPQGGRTGTSSGGGGMTSLNTRNSSGIESLGSASVLSGSGSLMDAAKSAGMRSALADAGYQPLQGGATRILGVGSGSRGSMGGDGRAGHKQVEAVEQHGTPSTATQRAADTLSGGWHLIRDPDGCSFYHNFVTGASVWQLPGGSSAPATPAPPALSSMSHLPMTSSAPSSPFATSAPAFALNMGVALAHGGGGSAGGGLGRVDELSQQISNPYNQGFKDAYGQLLAQQGGESSVVGDLLGGLGLASRVVGHRDHGRGGEDFLGSGRGSQRSVTSVTSNPEA